jgi:hypothetical protein
MEAELIALDTATVQADWIHEHLMDLPIVEKPSLTILMDCDNQMVIVKVGSSEDNMKSSRHITRLLNSIRKMRNFEVICDVSALKRTVSRNQDHYGMPLPK